MNVMPLFLADIVILLVLLFSGVSLPFCFGGALAFMAFMGGISIRPLVLWGTQQMMSLTFLAMPMFILAGQIMNDTGIANKLLDIARLIVGHLKGAVGLVCILTCAFLGAISGSSFTGVAAVGPVLIPEMRKDKYSLGFASALVAASSILGALIPPSTVAIMYGWITGTSILATFVSTVGPAICLIIIFGIMNYIYAKTMARSPVPKELQAKMNEVTVDGRTSKGRKIRQALINGIPAMLMPVIILGGIYGGIFTPAEAAAVAAATSIIIGVFCYRTLNAKGILQVLKRTAPSIGSVCCTTFCTLLLSQTFVLLRIPQLIVDMFMNITDSKFIILLIINAFLLLVGMIISDGTAVLLTAPLLLPIAVAYGVHPVHFGAIMLVNLTAGALTPPYASVLYLAMRVGECRFTEIIKPAMAFVCLGYIPIMLLTTYIEPIALFIPRVMGLL